MKSLLLACFLLLGACSSSGPSADRGRLVRNGQELRPAYQPMHIILDEAQFPVDASAVQAAATFWNKAAGNRRLFRINKDFGRVPHSGGLPGYVDGAVIISVAPFPTRYSHALGMTFSDTRDGRITSSVVMLNLLLILEPDLYRHVVTHELGHCLGLQDDVISVRHNSIMTGIARLRSNRVTARDRALLRSMF